MERAMGMMTREEALAEAKEKAIRAIDEMVLVNASWMSGDLDGLSAEDIEKKLSSLNGKETVVITGDHRGDEVDTYDMALRWTEARYSTMRHFKFPAGYYVIIATNRLRESMD